MGSIGDVYFSAHLQEVSNAEAKRVGDKAGTTAGGSLGSSLKSSFKKAFSGEALGHGLVEGLGLAGALSAAHLAEHAISEVVDVMKEAVTAAIADEQSQARLGQSLKANVKDWDGNTEAIEKSLKAGEALAFTAKEQRDSLAILVAATHDVNKALKVQAVAMDLARFKGISLAEASQALTKVEAGSYRILKSLGIQLPKNASQQDALNAVMKVANGQAQTYANTTGGKLLKAQVAWEESLIKLGTVALPLVSKAADMVTGFLNTLSDAIEQNGQDIALFFDLVNAALNPADLKNQLELQLDLMDKSGKATVDLRQKLNDLGVQVDKTGSGVVNETLAIYNQQQAAIKAAGGFDKWVAKQEAAQAAAGDTAGAVAAVGVAAKVAATRVTVSASDIVTAFKGMRDEIVGGGETVASALYDPIIKAGELAATQAELAATKVKLADKNLTKDEVKELQNRRQELGKQLIEQNAALLTYGTQAEQISKTKAFLASGFWVQAYKDATPEQKAALDAWRETLVSHLEDMDREASQGGADVRDGFIGPIDKGRPAVSTATEKMVGGIKKPMADGTSEAHTYGYNTGKAYADGLRATYGLVNEAAKHIQKGAVGPMEASSPPGPESPLHKIDVWGYRTGMAWVDGLATAAKAAKSATLDVARAAADGLSGALAVPQASRLSFAHAYNDSASSGPQRAVVNNNVTIAGLVKARDPFEVSSTMERFQRTGVLTWPEHEK